MASQMPTSARTSTVAVESAADAGPQASPPEPSPEPSPEPAGSTEQVRLPSGTLAAVRELVGAEQTAAFVAAATEREVKARAMDRFAAVHRSASADRRAGTESGTQGDAQDAG